MFTLDEKSGLSHMKLQVNTSERTDPTIAHQWSHDSNSPEMVLTVISDDLFKQSLVEYYKRKSFLYTNKIKCMVTNEWHTASKFSPCQIWNCSRSDMVQHFLAKDDLLSPRNGLVILRHIAEKYSSKELCFVYDALTCVFHIRILNPSLLDSQITDSKLKFQDIHGKTLQHPPGRLPFRRLLAHHARQAYEYASDCQWILPKEEDEMRSYFELAERASVAEFDFYI